MKKTQKHNGYVLHEDPSRVVIATGFNSKSGNRKTGSMVQVWILVKSENPVSAIKSGADRLICGNCPLRGKYGQTRACYVNVGQAPFAVWKAWTRGRYPRLDDLTVFAGKTVRFGAYGDPTHMPFELAKSIADASSGWTGYTHQWRKPLNQAWKSLVMASVETTADLRVAEAMGWRTFRVSADLEHHTGEVLCPSERGVSCSDCLLCSGTSRHAASIYIPVHGTGKKHFNV